MQSTGLVTLSVVGWRFGWETGCWAGRLAGTTSESGAANMVAGMVAWRDSSNSVSLVGCEAGYRGKW